MNADQTLILGEARKGRLVWLGAPSNRTEVGKVADRLLCDSQAVDSLGFMIWTKGGKRLESDISSSPYQRLLAFISGYLLWCR